MALIGSWKASTSTIFPTTTTLSSVNSFTMKLYNLPYTTDNGKCYARIRKLHWLRGIIWPVAKVMIFPVRVGLSHKQNDSTISAKTAGLTSTS